MNTIEMTETFDAWLSALRDPDAAARVRARIYRAEMGSKTGISGRLWNWRDN
jgi:putative component of toxin-antitoxin plasmid stabilization module